MQVKLYKIFLLLILFTSQSMVALPQAVFSVTVSPKVIGKNDTAELKLMIANAGTANITPPVLSNFIIVSGPTVKSDVQTVNGYPVRYEGYTYVLKAKSKGVFTIPSTTANVDGRILKSKPVVLKVQEQTPEKIAPVIFPQKTGETEHPTNYKDFILKKGESIQNKIDRNLFVKVVADKNSCYVGEPVLVTYKLYTRLKPKSKIQKSPSFNGFSVIDLAEPDWGESTRREFLNGKEYNVLLLRKAQLYPLQPGESYLEEAIVENNIRFIKDEYIKELQENGEPEFITGATASDVYLDTNVVVKNKPLSINVKALPASGKPNSFNGAVGTFVIDASLEKNNITTDDAGKLKIVLSGQGNITLLASPEISWPNGIEGFEPSVKDGLNRLSVPVSGNKIFEYSFTAIKEGDYTIKTIAFSYFDIDSGKYKTVNTKPITVHITKGTGKRPSIADTIKANQESLGQRIFTHRWMITVPVALLIISGLLIWVRIDKKRQKEKLTAVLLQSKEDKIAEETMLTNPLEQSEKTLLQNDAKAFYKTLDKELHYFLAQKLKLPVETISKKSIADGLDRSGIALADSLAIQKLLDNVSMQLYTPFADETKMQDYYVEALSFVNIFKA